MTRCNLQIEPSAAAVLASAEENGVAADFCRSAEAYRSCAARREGNRSVVYPRLPGVTPASENEDSNPPRHPLGVAFRGEVRTGYLWDAESHQYLGPGGTAKPRHKGTRKRDRKDHTVEGWIHQTLDKAQNGPLAPIVQWGARGGRVTLVRG